MEQYEIDRHSPVAMFQILCFRSPDDISLGEGKLRSNPNFRGESTVICDGGDSAGKQALENLR